MFKKKGEKMNLATEIISDLMVKLNICRIILGISLAVNAILAAMLVLR